MEAPSFSVNFYIRNELHCLIIDLINPLTFIMSTFNMGRMAINSQPYTVLGHKYLTSLGPPFTNILGILFVSLLCLYALFCIALFLSFDMLYPFDIAHASIAFRK